MFLRYYEYYNLLYLSEKWKCKPFTFTQGTAAISWYSGATAVLYRLTAAAAAAALFHIRSTYDIGKASAAATTTTLARGHKPGTNHATWEETLQHFYIIDCCNTKQITTVGFRPATNTSSSDIVLLLLVALRTWYWLLRQRTTAFIHAGVTAATCCARLFQVRYVCHTNGAGCPLDTIQQRSAVVTLTLTGTK